MKFDTVCVNYRQRAGICQFSATAMVQSKELQSNWGYWLVCLQNNVSFNQIFPTFLRIQCKFSLSKMGSLSGKIESHSHSQLSKKSLRTLILILNSQKIPWELSFSFSTLKKILERSHSRSRLSVNLLSQKSGEKLRTNLTHIFCAL